MYKLCNCGCQATKWVGEIVLQIKIGKSRYSSLLEEKSDGLIALTDNIIHQVMALIRSFSPPAHLVTIQVKTSTLTEISAN